MSIGNESLRSLNMSELLETREIAWGKRMRGASLVAETGIKPAHSDQVAMVLARGYRHRDDPRGSGARFLARWPACVAAAMAGVAATGYIGGTYWPAFWRAAQLPGDAIDQAVWGRAFNESIAALDMATFPELPLTYVGPILMHAGIPNYCLGDYFKLLLERTRVDPLMDAESFLAWAGAPGRDKRLSSLDVPAQRFLWAGGSYAVDVVDRCLDLLDRLADTDPDLEGIRLPERIIEAARQAVAQQDAGQLRDRQRNARSKRKAQQRPHIALDPHGAGVIVVLPAVGSAPDGTATWRVVADGEPVTVRSRAQWVGAAEAAPATHHALSRPVRAVQVSLTGQELASDLRVVEPSDPILFFGDDGRRLPGNLPLPPDQVWILYPEDRDLRVAGELRQVSGLTAPFGWEGWQLQLVSLERAQAISVDGGTRHEVQGQTRPRLEHGDPVLGVRTPYGSVVYADLPQLWLPDSLDAEVTWNIEVRQAGSATALVSKKVRADDHTDIWDGIPQPVLGSFDVTVRGPLGRGLRRNIFIAQGLGASYRPDPRGLRSGGLEPGEARLTAAIGATAAPAQLRFGNRELAHLVEYRTAAETEPLVVTPPHVEVLCAAAGASSWSSAPVHLVTEAVADSGRLLVRTAGLAGLADLEVWVGSRRVQTIRASGRKTPGLASYQLAEAADSILVHGRAEVMLPSSREAMPVCVVRPRQLATGAEVRDSQIVLHDCARVEGLVAAVYLLRAPWRLPTVLAVPEDGVIQLPADLEDAGPLRVVVRVDDPWSPAPWPAWPGSGYFACAGDGVPACADEEEQALSRYLADGGILPEHPERLDRLWRILDLADDLISAGSPAGIAGQASAVLREQPAQALAALPAADLGVSRQITALVASGLAAARPGHPDTVSAAELWQLAPGAAAVISADLIGSSDADSATQDGAVTEAAAVQCGHALAAVLASSGDADAAVGRFGPEAERMAVLQPEQIDALWQAAAVVPQALLDADTRLAAARRMFDHRRTAALRSAARQSTEVVRAAENLIKNSAYPFAWRQVAARQHPGGKGGWLALPAMSAALAVIARLAARGDDRCQRFDQYYRRSWIELTSQAAELAEIDIVLAEVLLASAEATRSSA